MPGTTRRLDEAFVTLRREPCLLWRAVRRSASETLRQGYSEAVL
jgi:hypothetical protein